MPAKTWPALRGVEVGPHRLEEHLAQRSQGPVVDRLGQRVGRKAPDVIRPRGGVGADAFRARDLRDAGQVLVGLPRVVDVRQHAHLVGANPGDPQVVDGDEAAHAAAHGDEGHVHHRDPRRSDHGVGPRGRLQEFLGQVAAARRPRLNLGLNRRRLTRPVRWSVRPHRPITLRSRHRWKSPSPVPATPPQATCDNPDRSASEVGPERRAGVVGGHLRLPTREVRNAVTVSRRQAA